MSVVQDGSRTDILVVGAGPAGLCAALAAKAAAPGREVCVVEKASGLGEHNLSGAVLETGPLESLLDRARPGWREDPEGRAILGRRAAADDVLFLTRRRSLSLSPAVALGRRLGLSFGGLSHEGDAIVSVSRLTRWLGRLAREASVEVLTGFGAESVVLGAAGLAEGARLVDRGRGRDGSPQVHFRTGETVSARFVILAEGCDGTTTERFVAEAGLARRTPQLFSVGVKEVVQLSPERARAFGERRVLHTVGWPLWTPLVGPGLFGGGLLYSCGEDQLAAGLIVGADWPHRDFSPQEAFSLWKEHPLIASFLDGGQAVAAGAKMIPEGGWRALPRDPATGSVGRGNVLIVGDAAGLVDMHRIKGLHNAAASGALAGEAAAGCWDRPAEAARRYTAALEACAAAADMRRAGNFRQVVARLGPELGLAASPAAAWLPPLRTEPDRLAMDGRRFPYRPRRAADRDAFTALAGASHREDQPSHTRIRDAALCAGECARRFDQPCRSFCPAAVYETTPEGLRAANPSNCLHCKTCQRKCPLDNIRWGVPEGGGPRYRSL